MNIAQFVDSKVWWPEKQGKKMSEEEINIIQEEILKFPKCRMLQIGTNFGWTVWNVLKQLDKVGGSIDTVDYAYAKAKQLKRTMKWVNHVKSVLQTYDLNGMVRYFTEGSNHFFQNECDTTYHVVFIDGDHSHKQSKRDLMNSINVLCPSGVIVMHDIRKSKYLGKKSCLRTFQEFEDPKFTKTLIKTKYRLGVLRSNLDPDGDPDHQRIADVEL